jgi:hypothetical protein
MAKRRAPAKAARQLELDAAAAAREGQSKQPPAPKAKSADHQRAMAKRAIARRSVDAQGYVKIALSIPRATAEAISERAIRESRSFEDVAAEILEQQAKR